MGKRVLLLAIAAGWFFTFMVCCDCLHAEIWFVTYDASENTLPDQQGWVLQNTPADTDPWMAGGLLRMDTTVLQYLNWRYLDAYVCFPSDHGFILEFELKVNSSTYVDIPSSRWRIGYIVSVADSQGRIFRIGIAGSGVIISNDAEWYYSHSSPFVGYDTTDGFHTYKFVVQNNLGQLWIDDVPIVSLAAGATNQQTPNCVLFGDATFHADSDTEMTYFRFGLTKTPGDANGNDEINLLDLKILAQNWLRTDCSCPDACNGADLNQSGGVDLFDYAILAGQWLQ